MNKDLEKSILIFLFLLPLVPPLAYVPLLVALIIWFRRGWNINLGRYLDPAHPNLYLLILILTAFFSAILSNYKLLSLGSFVLFLIFPLTYFLFYENIKRLDRKKILLTILLSGFLVSLLGLIQKTGFGFEYHSEFLNISFHDDGGIRSTLGHPNRVAAFLVLITPLLLISILCGDRRWRITGVIFLIVAIPALVLTTSLGGILALGLSLLILLLVRERRLGYILLILILFFVAFKFGLVKNILEDYSTMEDRFYTWWYVCPQIFLDHPLTGIGIGTYVKISPLYGDQELTLSTGLHNLYLRILIELGLLGFIPFLLFLATLSKRIVLHLKTHFFYDKDGLVAGCGFSILGILFHAMVQDIIDFLPIGLLFWSMAGMAVGLTEKGQHSNTG